MRRLLIAFALLCAFSAQTAFAYSSPGKPSGYVNDFANTLTTETKQTLEAELAQFEASTTNEVVLAIVPDMGDDYIENYAVKLFEEWGVGKKDKDNGVLLLLSMKERAMRIEVGYGLEGALVDANANKILAEMKQPLRDGNPDLAVTTGLRLIQESIKGEYRPSTNENISSAFFDNFEFIFFAGLFVLQWFASVLARSKSWWAGGVFGALSGAIAGWVFTSSALALGLLVASLGILGLFFDYVVSTTYQYHKARGSTQPWWIGGNHVGGGRIGGGGFGGFGGGRSGGGGASGRW